jgi:hypothetical protein
MKTARKKKLFLNLCHKMTSHLTKQAFEIKYNSPSEPEWRNWQTRYVQGVVSLRS